jgi:hypothetical protein
VRVTNEIGILADLLGILDEAGLTIRAISGLSRGGRGEISLISDDNARAVEVLKAHRYGPELHPAIVLETDQTAGLLKQLVKCLACGGINIERAYASAADAQQRCLIVMHTSDDERALERLRNRHLSPHEI